MKTIYPGEIPEEGLHLSGSLSEDIFQLDPADEVRPAGPTLYDLQILRSGDVVFAQGSLETLFTLRCVVCLEDFSYTNRIDPYGADFDLEETDGIDLKERIREDLLLNLPAYPHCDEGDDPDRVCPMAEQLAAPETSGDEPKPSAWDALDGLKNEKKSDD